MHAVDRVRQALLLRMGPKWMRWVIWAQIAALAGVAFVNGAVDRTSISYYSGESLISLLCAATAPLGLLVLPLAEFWNPRAMACIALQVVLLVAWLIATMPLFQ